MNESDVPCENCGILVHYIVYDDGLVQGPWQPHVDFMGQDGYLGHRPDRCRAARQAAANVDDPRLLVSSYVGDEFIVRERNA